MNKNIIINTKLYLNDVKLFNYLLEFIYQILINIFFSCIN